MTTPTSAQLLTLDGIVQRVEWVRFEVLDAALAVVGELFPDYGTATIDNNINRSIKRTLSGLSLHPADLAAFDKFAHRVRPVFVAEDGTQWPLGVFLVADYSVARVHMLRPQVASSTGPWTHLGDLGLVDQGLILDQPLDRTIGYGTGQSIQQAVVALAAEAGVPAVQVDFTAAVVQAPVVWVSGSNTRLQVINELLAMAGFFSAYFDNQGVLRYRRVPDLATTPVDFDYDTPARVFEGSVVETDDTLSAPNRYVVVGTSAGGAPVVGTWDVPATAPHSFSKRGFRVVHVTTTQGLEPSGAADAARAVGQQDNSTFQWADFTAAADPRHDTFQLVTWQGVRWREQSWSLGLAAGAGMRHQLRRVYV